MRHDSKPDHQRSAAAKPKATLSTTQNLPDFPLGGGAANRAMMACPGGERSYTASTGRQAICKPLPQEPFCPWASAGVAQWKVDGQPIATRTGRSYQWIPVFVPVTKAMKQRTWPRFTAACSPLAFTPLTACVARGAPSSALFGAYFPFWLLSAVMGIVGALVAHRVFVATGWARTVPYQLSVCTAIGVVVGVLVWLSGTGQL